MEKITIEETKKIINKIFNQASTGYFEIDSIDSQYTGPWKFYTKYYAKVGNKLLKNGENIFKPACETAEIVNDNINIPIIKIPNSEAFALAIHNYLQIAEKFFADDKKRFSLYDESFREKLVFDLFSNTTNFDRHNIISYIETRTKIIQSLLQTGNFLINSTPDYEIKAYLYKVPSTLEGPYRFTPYFESKVDGKFIIPSITFGIVDDTVHIYAIQAQREKQSSQLAKKLDRYFRKVNKDVDMDDIIGQVSPNALVSLTIFLSVMQKEGIKNIVAPNFMPLRYLTNLSGEANRFEKTQEGFMHETSLDEIVEKHNKHQFNISNKFTYTLLRYCHHFDGCQYNYDEAQEASIIKLSKDNTPDDNIIHQMDALCSHQLGIREDSKQK